MAKGKGSSKSKGNKLRGSKKRAKSGRFKKK